MQDAPNFPLNDFQIGPEWEKAVRVSWAALAEWRSFIIGVDGRAGIGKSVFARYLSFRLNMPVIELDNFKTGNGLIAHSACANELVSRRHERNRPVIIEGVLLQDILATMGRSADFLIRFVKPEDDGPDEFLSACEDYEMRTSPDLIVSATHLD
ncbi:hypothetical protein BMG00_15995 [Thioclava marina]|uniref:Uridine kinase n=1 Tax=Thioclava marina TaxID=1915077 RepID=A0ABX3MI45_9RHOB|nr:hypothetical protein BMG00_15995 [Thioclava marina]